MRRDLSLFVRGSKQHRARFRYGHNMNNGHVYGQYSGATSSFRSIDAGWSGRAGGDLQAQSAWSRSSAP